MRGGGSRSPVRAGQKDRSAGVTCSFNAGNHFENMDLSNFSAAVEDG